MNAAIIGAVCLLVAAAVEPDLEKQVGEIFAVVDTELPRGASRSPVQTRLNKLAPSADADPRLRYAYVVALIHEKRYSDALREVTALTKSKPKYLAAQRARAWLLLSQKKYSEALTTLETISKLIPSQEGVGTIEMADVEAAQFLGTAMGFLEGPAEKLVKEPVRTQYKTRIEARLTGKRREVFDEQLQSVGDLYAEFLEHGEEAFAKADQKTSEQLQVVEKDKLQIADEQAKTERDAERVSQQLRARWEQLQNDWSTLHANYTEVTAQALALQNQRSQALSQLNLLENAPKDKDGNLSRQDRDALIRWAPALRQTIGRLDTQTMRASLALERMVQQGQALEVEMSRVVVAGQAAGETFAMKDQLFAKEAKALAGREARAKRKAPKGPKVSERAHAFTTYDDFNFEAEKQRILDSLADA